MFRLQTVRQKGTSSGAVARAQQLEAVHEEGLGAEAVELLLDVVQHRLPRGAWTGWHRGFGAGPVRCLNACLLQRHLLEGVAGGRRVHV